MHSKSDAFLFLFIVVFFVVVSFFLFFFFFFLLFFFFFVVVVPYTILGLSAKGILDIYILYLLRTCLKWSVIKIVVSTLVVGSNIELLFYHDVQFALSLS